MQIKNRTFIISGGASGLGLATAKELHSQGGYIAILDLNAENGEKAVKELGSNAKFFEVDITQTESLQKVVKSIVEWISQTSKPIGGVIPAAGVGLPGLLIDRHNEPIPMAKLDFVININLRGVLDLLRLTLPHIANNEPNEEGERGVLILVSSSAAFEGQSGQLSYAATKGALRAMTLVLARDFSSRGIRCMSVAPSYFESNMTAVMTDKVKKSLSKAFEFPNRPGRAPEFAACVRHCIENTMLNGEVIRLDGATRMPARL